MRVLLIEDDENMASFVRKGLKEEGFTVAHEADGESGLHLALTEGFDAAIVDVMLPDINGLEALRRLREGGDRTPILIMSTLTDRRYRERAEELGASFLNKPFTPLALMTIVQRLLSPPPAAT